MKKYIYIRTQLEAFHKWKNAPKEVKFLRNIHRHIFKIKVGVSVINNEREIEFFIFKDKIDKFLVPYHKKEIGSCEKLAESIISFLKQEYPNRFYFVEVSEDGENGVIFQFDNES